MILDEQPSDNAAETALLSETALAQDWDRPEEDEAWPTCSGLGSPGTVPVILIFRRPSCVPPSFWQMRELIGAEVAVLQSSGFERIISAVTELLRAGR